GARQISRQAQRALPCGRNCQGAGGDSRGLVRGNFASDHRKFLPSVQQSASSESDGMTLSLTILGCGSSAGVPRVAQGWGACDPNNPKNRRRRCSILLERESGSGKTIVLVDMSPDLRAQLLEASVQRLDAILMTHAHADHTHGIDDIRPLVIEMGSKIDIHMD